MKQQCAWCGRWTLVFTFVAGLVNCGRWHHGKCLCLLLPLFIIGCAGSPTAPAPVPVAPPAANIINVPAPVEGDVQSDGTYALSPSGQNTGLGCAGNVAGSTDIRNDAGPVKTLTWTLPAGTVVQPGERFTYRLCCLSPAEAFSPGILYNTRFSYTTVACPIR